MVEEIATYTDMKCVSIRSGIRPCKPYAGLLISVHLDHNKLIFICYDL